MTTVRIKTIRRIPRTLRYEQSGVVTLPCRLVPRPTGSDRTILVELLEAGAGYPAGHVLMVGVSDVVED